MATLIKPDGSEEKITPANGKTFTLEELNKLVEGYIEVIYLSNGNPIILNEEGKLLNLPYNLRATLIGRACGIANDDYIVGNILVCSREEIE